jgi:prepilin-type N-terminal cleavage/methylation domain-containing protein
MTEMRKWNLQRGFTLMELMVVIVIVAILAAVAVPLYINYVKDARRTEAKGAIGAFVTGANRYYQEQQPETYVGFETQTTWAKYVDVTDVQGNWQFAVTNTGTGGFQVDATGQNQATGLGVRMVYTRGAAPVWTDDPGP